jgi:hypothetical protein
MKIILSVIVVMLMIGAPSVMAFQAYWTPYSDSIKDYRTQGLQQYHLFMEGTFPSSIDRSTKLVNQDLSVCLGFPINHIYPTLIVCHPIKESEIPKINDSIVDAGYLVISDKLNQTAIMACTQVGYHDMGEWCNGQTVDGNSASENAKYLAMMGPTYEDVQVYYACLNYHHLKEGTQAFYDCEKAIS